MKYWKIANDKSFVYGIDFLNQYRTGVQTFGLNDKVFMKKKYYNVQPFKDPYIIENILGEEIEPTYDNIMSEINREVNLSAEIRNRIILWLFISQIRSPYIRNNTERIANFIYETSERLKNKTFSAEKGKMMEAYAKQVARETHLKIFIDNDRLESLLNLHVDILQTKHWKILKSIPQFEFLTNDNPGFSLNTDPELSKVDPYHPMMKMNPYSIIYHPLSPKYCLQMMPYPHGLEIDVFKSLLQIKYEQAPSALIEFINKGIFKTRIRILVSKNKEILEYCIKRK